MPRLIGGKDRLIGLIDAGKLPSEFNAEDVLVRFPGGTTKQQIFNLLHSAEQNLIIRRTTDRKPRKYRPVGKPTQRELPLQEVAPIPEVSPQIHPFDVIIDSVIEKVLKGVSAQLKIMEDNIVRRLHSNTAITSTEPFLPEPPPEKKALPKVLLVGLLKGQQRMMENEYKDMLDLRFARKDSLVNLGKKASNVDCILSMTSKFSHAEDKTLTQAGVEYHRVFGGMTSIRKKLDEIALQHMSD